MIQTKVTGVAVAVASAYIFCVLLGLLLGIYTGKLKDKDPDE